jgi:hypothetical protein
VTIRAAPLTIEALNDTIGSGLGAHGKGSWHQRRCGRGKIHQCQRDRHSRRTALRAVGCHHLTRPARLRSTRVR